MTLDSYKGKVRVIRAVVTKPREEPSGHGTSPSSASARVSLGAERRCKSSVPVGIKDTGFNQWIKYWNFGRVFRHTPIALMAVFLLWTLAFNLLQLYVYRRLGRCRSPKDPTETIRHIVEVVLRDVATLSVTHTLGWLFCWRPAVWRAGAEPKRASRVEPAS